MSLLDILKTIFGGKSGDVLSNNKIKVTLFNFSKTNHNTIEQKGDIFSIDLSKATPEERILLFQKVINTDFDKNGTLLISKTPEKTLLIKRNLPKEDDADLLDFYKDKLTPDMYKALELSLTVRSCFRNGEDITELKRDISSKYPSFGNNLSNLVSQDYFDKHFKDLFNSMLEDEEFDILIYQRKVEKIVKSLPYTVFITKYKPYKELSGEVEFKLQKLIKYGAGKLLLHGLGKENVLTILKILGDYKEDKRVQIEMDMNPKQTIITATLKF